MTSGVLAIGQNCRIHDPSAGWDRDLTVKIVGFVTLPQCPLVPPWPLVRSAEGWEFVINPARLYPTARPLAAASSQPSLFGDDHHAGRTSRAVGPGAGPPGPDPDSEPG